jgi:hypothetical protein
MLTVKGVGPVWVGHEAGAAGKRISTAWFREIDRPYRVGRGVRVRFGEHGLAIGVVTEHHRRDGEDDYTGLMAHDVTAPAAEIRKWGENGEEAQAEGHEGGGAAGQAVHH